MGTDWTFMDDIEDKMFWDCHKDDDNKYVMPDDYCSWEHIDDVIIEMDEEDIKKLVDDYGVLKAIKHYRYINGDYLFDKNEKEDEDDDKIYRILAEYIITKWIEDMEMVSEMNMTEYEEQNEKDDSDDDE